MTVVVEEISAGELVDDGQQPQDANHFADDGAAHQTASVDPSATITMELEREVARLRGELHEIGINPDIDSDVRQSDDVLTGDLNDPRDSMILSQEPQLSDQTLEYETGDTYKGETRGIMRHGYGVHTCPNGDIYTGQWRLDQRHGTGKMVFASGLIYEGEWKFDKACGHGKCVYENGNVYNGEWKNDHRSGWGKLEFSNGGCYEGEWLDDHVEGTGQFVEVDGSVFEGIHSKNQRVKGKYISADKAVEYNGDWKGQSMHGHGVLHDARRGIQYSGEWANDLMEGRGSCRYNDGALYDGHWVAGLRAGEGTLLLADGSKFVGNWCNDMRNGIGHYTSAAGERYIGEWKDGLRHGKGRSIQIDGDKYEGEWKMDKRHGDGKCIYTNGDKYEGSWRDGMRHGYGICVFSDGTVFRGEWEEDAWVQSSADPMRCKIEGPGICRAVAGSSASFTIEDLDCQAQSNSRFDVVAFDENGNKRLCGGDDFRCSLIGLSGEQVHGQVNDQGDGLYLINYIATAAGRYQLHCTIGSHEEVEQSPYPVLVLPALPSLKHCRVSGDGKSKAMTGVPSTFYIESFDEYGNPTSTNLEEAFPISVSISSMDVDCPVTVLAKSSRGVYVCEYTAQTPGLYRIEVLSGKSHLPGSPFSLQVNKECVEAVPAQESAHRNTSDGSFCNDKDQDSCVAEDQGVSPEAGDYVGQKVKDLSSHWMTIAASAFGEDGCMDGWDSEPEDKLNDTDDYAKNHPEVPIIENLEDLWQLSKLQRERKQREQKEKAARLEMLQKQLEKRFGGGSTVHDNKSPRNSALPNADMSTDHSAVATEAGESGVAGSMRSDVPTSKSSLSQLDW